MAKGHKNKFIRNPKTDKATNYSKNIFRISSSEQSSDYENTSQYLINNIKKECVRVNDVSETLRNLTLPDITK